MTSLIFPIAPALLLGNSSASVRHPSSFIQNQVRNSSGGQPVEHHDGDQLVQTGEQYRPAGKLNGQKFPDNRQEAVRAQEMAEGGLFHHHHLGHQYWRNRSYFFGSTSPFDPSSDNSGGGSGYGFGYGYGYGFGLGYGLGYIGASYGAGYGMPLNDNYLPIHALYTGRVPRVRLASAAQFDDEVPADQVQSSLGFAEQGEVDFKQGKYKLAVQSWRHALVDDPRNGAIVLLLGQALFAIGQYDEAAGATQAALSMLPEDKWGAVITHYKEIYPNVADYTSQIRALEKARDAKPDVPALHFLLGYHFGYLNYPKHAVRELDKVLAVVPKDKIAQKLRDEFAAKLSDADKAALEKQGNKPADDDKSPGDAKTPAKPDQSSDTPADDKGDTDKPSGTDKTDGKDGATKGDAGASSSGTDI